MPMKQSEIARKRKQYGVTQTDLANGIGVKLRTVQLWEAGTSRLAKSKLDKVEQYFRSLEFIQSGKDGDTTHELINVLFLSKNDPSVDLRRYADSIIEKLRLYEAVKMENEKLRLEPYKPQNERDENKRK